MSHRRKYTKSRVVEWWFADRLELDFWQVVAISLIYGRFWGLYGGVRLSHLRAYVVLLYAFVYNGLCVYNVYKLILR